MLHTADIQQTLYVVSVQLGENSHLSLTLGSHLSVDKPLLTSFPS